MAPEALAEHSARDADWPMPSAEVRRLLEPVPHWEPVTSDESERETD